MNDQSFIAQQIRSRYIDKPQTRLEELLLLDKKVKKPVNVFAWIFGSISAIIMGAGMSLVMTDIGTYIGIKEPMIPGIAIGVVGMGLALLTYPIYKRMLGNRRQKYADKILALSNEIMQEK